MASRKDHCSIKEQEMEPNDSFSSGDTDELESDTKRTEVCSYYTGVRLMYFEHSYSQNWASLCELYQNSKLKSEVVTAYPENVNIQVPVRRSQRQINKSENDISSSLNVENVDSTETPIKPLTPIEEKVKENSLSKSNMHFKNVTILKNKSPRKECNPKVDDGNYKALSKEKGEQIKCSKINPQNKLSASKVNFENEPNLDTKLKAPEEEDLVKNGANPIVDEMDVAIFKVSKKEGEQTEPLKILKKAKISLTKVISEKEQSVDLMHKTPGEADFIENGANPVVDEMDVHNLKVLSKTEEKPTKPLKILRKTRMSATKVIFGNKQSLDLKNKVPGEADPVKSGAIPIVDEMDVDNFNVLSKEGEKTKHSQILKKTEISDSMVISETEQILNLKRKAPVEEDLVKIGDNSIVDEMDDGNSKVLSKEEEKQTKPSKIPRKIELSNINEKDQNLDLKRKAPGKEDLVKNGDLKNKNDKITMLEDERKGTYSKPSKEVVLFDNVEKEIAKNKKAKSSRMVEESNKINIDDSTELRKRKRNLSAPSNKTEVVKNSKDLGPLKKGKKKKCISLSEEPVENECAKIENKKRLSIEIKSPDSKRVSHTSKPVVKPKLKKSSRRESLRLVINEDEPPLFSQPDMMVKVKSDNTVSKKEEKFETEEKSSESSSQEKSSESSSQGKSSESSSQEKSSEGSSQEKSSEGSSQVDHSTESEQSSPEKIVSVEPIQVSKIQDIVLKSHENVDEVKEVKDKAKEDDPQSNADIPSIIYYCDKYDFKDFDSENSLHIDESVDKICEGEINDCSKHEFSENMFDSSVTSSSLVKENLSKEQEEDSVNTELSNSSILKTIEPNVKDADSDKPIAERKPRRIIKKKEFFEDIASRSSAQAKKSVGKQKGKDKKGNNEDPKKGKRSTGHKPIVESDDSSEDDPMKLWCICRQPHNDRFMIQCDACEDWFHGSCVGVSRQQGRKLEKQQKEWHCPNCLSKESKAPKIENVIAQKLELIEKRVNKNEVKETVEDKLKTNLSLLKKVKVVVDKIDATPPKTQSEKSSPKSSSSLRTDSASVPPSSLNKKSFNKNTIRSILKGSDLASSHKKGLKEPIKKKQDCIVCQTVAAAANSCYCGEKCLEKHVADCLTTMREAKGALKGPEFDAQKVVVLDRIKGSVIAGDNAPTAGNVVFWLKANPSFMIARSSSASTSLKKETTDQNLASAVKEKNESSDETSKATVRLNVRKTLKNILMDRCKNANDLQLPEEEIRKIAVKIEEELNSLFKDNSFKYRAKYRSLMFNIKDPRNQGLFRKILKGNILPDKLVRMSPEELASMELAKWREQENQHLLDMIKRGQLEQQSGSGLLLKKTHKGEVEIEDDLTSIIDDIPKSSKPYPGELPEYEKPEPDTEVVVKDTTHHHRSHLFDLNCKICTGKVLPPPVEDNTPKKIRVAHSISVDCSPASIDSVEKTVSRIVDGKSPLSSAGDDSQDQEPTSTVSIGYD